MFLSNPLKAAKARISHIYYNTVWGYYVLWPARALLDVFKYRLNSDKKHIEKKYFKKFGKPIDWDNPQTLNEKICWLKLYDRTELHTIAADKYRAREYISKRIGEDYLVPLVLFTHDPSDIRPENLPDYPIIIKTNHDSSGGVIIKDKSKIDWRFLQFRLSKSLKQNYYYQNKEWQYKHIEPGIVVEKLLFDGTDVVSKDFRIHCFNGKAAMINVSMDKENGQKRNLYDLNWNQLPCEWKHPNGNQVDRPARLEDAISLAEKLAKDFVYVRVDFYLIGCQIFTGELTFHPGSGSGQFRPQEWDLKFGSMLQLPDSHVR